MAKFVCGCGICGKRIEFKDVDEMKELGLVSRLAVKENPNQSPTSMDVVMCFDCKVEYNKMNIENDTKFYGAKVKEEVK